MNSESPFIGVEIVDRPLGPPEPDDMWDSLVDFVETDEDLEALIAMREQAEG